MRVGPATNVARINVSENITALWTFAHANGISLDDIIERTLNAGVTIDGVRLKDGVFDNRDYTLGTALITLIRVVGDTNNRFSEDASGKLLWGSGAVAQDTDIFRALADVLATSDSFRVAGVLGVITDIITERTAAAGVTIDGVKLKDGSISVPDLPAAGNIAIESAVAADAEFRFRRQADGTMLWGDGALAPDTNLYRDAVGVLKTDDSLEVAGASGVITNDLVERTLDAGVTVDSVLLKDGGIGLLGDLTMAGRTIALALGGNADVATGTVPVQRLSVVGGNADISGFAGGVAGRLLIVYSVVAFTITLQNENAGSAPANRLQCTSTVDLLLGLNESAMLWYDGAISRWQMISSSI